MEHTMNTGKGTDLGNSRLLQEEKTGELLKLLLPVCDD